MTDLQHIRLECEKLGIRASAGVSLKDYTSFKIGGAAQVFLAPEDEAQLCACLRLCHNAQIRPFILGRGSNLLVADEGIPNVVLYTGALRGMRKVGEEQIFCACGEPLSRVCDFAAEQALTGLEFAFGIPGSLGGAVYMNAGAYGGEMRDVLEACACVDEKGSARQLKAAELCLDYRHSIFMQAEMQGWVITGAYLRLASGEQEAIRQTMRGVMEKRKTKQPLQYPSAGSVFKRPPNAFAAALIEQCGLKGETIGGAQVSEKHSGFIINIGGATAQDVKDLIAFVQKTVQKKCGICLEREIRYIP